MHILSPVTDNCPSLISGNRNGNMWPDWVSNPGPLPLESDALPTALRGPAVCVCVYIYIYMCVCVCVCVCVRERERERGAYTVMSPVGNSTLDKS